MAQHPGRKQLPGVPRKLWWHFLGMGKGGFLVWCGQRAQPVSPSGLGTSPGTGAAAGFIAPWDSPFVKGRSSSPDTATSEDESLFSAVRLPTPLILRAQTMNFFNFIYFPSSVPSHCPATARQEPNRWCFAGKLERPGGYRACPPHGHVATSARKNLDFLWERQRQRF